MKYNARIFVPATTHHEANRVSKSFLDLNKPGGAGSILLVGLCVASLPPCRDFFFCNNLNKRRHAHRNLSPIRPGQDRPHKPGNSTSTNGRLAAVLPPALLPLTH